MGRAKRTLVLHSLILDTSEPLTDRRRELLSKERHCDRYQQIKTDPVLGGMGGSVGGNRMRRGESGCRVWSGLALSHYSERCKHTIAYNLSPFILNLYQSTRTILAIMAASLSSAVSSLQSSLQLLDSSINTLDSGVNDFPRLTKVLQTTRVSLTSLQFIYIKHNG